jgi:hypothetical protein
MQPTGFHKYPSGSRKCGVLLFLMKNIQSWAGDVAQLVELLPELIPSNQKNDKNTQRQNPRDYRCWFSKHFDFIIT